MAQFLENFQEKFKTAWIPLLSMAMDSSCVVSVQLNPDGTVTKVEVFSPCAENQLLNSAIETAVKKTSPLTVPSNPEVFEQNFRSFTFTLKFEASR